MVNSSDELDVERFKKLEDYADAEFILDETEIIVVARLKNVEIQCKLLQMLFAQNTVIPAFV
jgi:hypothetical protein